MLGGAFAALAILVSTDWLRHRDRARLWLAVSAVLLGLVAVLGAAAATLASTSGLVTDVLLAIFVLSGWAFLEFRDSLIPLRSRTRRTVAATVAATILLLVIAYPPWVPVPTGHASGLQAGAALVLLGVWAGCVLEPVLRLWFRSRRLPGVQRSRLRALTLAYALIIGLLVLDVIVGLAGAGNRFSAVTTALSLVVVPLFYVAYAPPAWLRRFWREREEEGFRAALSDLLLYSADVRALAERSVEWPARLVGADATVITGRGGSILAAYGVDPEGARALAEGVDRAGPRRAVAGSLSMRDHNAPIRIAIGGEGIRGALIVRAGPLTPVFGGEEIQRLHQYSRALTMAMQRVATEESLRRNAQLLDLAYDAILTWDLDSDSITYWNRAAEALYGWTAEEAVGRTPHEVLKTEFVNAEITSREEVVRFLRTTGQWEGELRQVAKDGRVMYVSARWALHSRADGSRGLVLEINRDISHTKLAAEELRDARDEAQRASQAKSEYLSRMSHELRTPLTAMLGYSDLLELRTPRPDQLEAIAAIQQASGHLLSLVNDVLDIARIEAGRERLSTEPVSVASTIGECVRLVTPAAMERGTQLSSDLGHAAGEFVNADRQRLVQSLLNLLSNAVKYSGDGARVVARAERQGRFIRFAVEDSGPGLTDSQRERLFQPFERLGAERTTTQGTGLGLALTKKLVEAMDGDIGVDTEPGRGCTFWILLERAEPVVVRTTESNGMGAAPTGDRRTVLYVEDNLATIELMEEIFAMRPQIHLITAMQGGLTLDLAREHQPDMIMLDLHLPDIPGDEVLARLRADPRTRHIPIVIFSADATERQVKRLLDAGARAYLTKPAKVKEFLQTLDEVLAAPPVAVH